MKFTLTLFISIVLFSPLWSQMSNFTSPFSGNNAFENPTSYQVRRLKVEGALTDPTGVVSRSGLQEGKRVIIPGDQITTAIKKLWDTGLYTDVQIYVSDLDEKNSQLDLIISVKQTPQITGFYYIGLKKSEQKELDEELAALIGARQSKNTELIIRRIVQRYFEDKNRSAAKIEIFESKDPVQQNAVTMNIQVDKGPKVRIKEINIVNNYGLPDSKLRRSMKETKQPGIKNFYRGGKFHQREYKEDLKLLEAAYRNYGYRDAKVVEDSVYFLNDKRVAINISVEEGNRYYYRNIFFEGNTKYTDDQLKRLLNIKEGDIYSLELLQKKLFMDPEGGDISSLYLDDGYLFFEVEERELRVQNDSIDLKIIIREGDQARIGQITISGNTKTSDHVILREIYTKPGELFRRSDIMRSQSELNNLKYFNPEKMNVVPKPNPANGTVDIEYILEEQPSDQFELQGGYGAGFIVGTLGLNFTNFSSKKIFQKGGWSPIPSGDGQSLSIRAQSSGRFFQSYNFSFVEPWLGGKKPRALSFSAYHTRLTQPGGFQNITGVSLGLGNRLKWPDNFFRFNTSLGYQLYDINNFPGINLAAGTYNNANIKFRLSRNSVDQPIYPRSGVEFDLNAQFTLPMISLFNSPEEIAEKAATGDFNWIEYHKYVMHLGWYNKIVDKLVLFTKVNFGVMSSYSRALGVSPFERFYMGGSGLMGFNIDGREIIPLRGYQDASQTNVVYEGDGLNGGIGAIKYTMELRYPLTLQPSATIFMLGFFEAGNTFANLSNFDPFNVNRAVGGGVRLFLPMIGMLGFDYGFPFNPANPSIPKESFRSFPGQFTFTFGGNISGW